MILTLAQVRNDAVWFVRVLLKLHCKYHQGNLFKCKF